MGLMVSGCSPTKEIEPVSNPLFYFAGDKYVTALDSKTGDVKWQWPKPRYVGPSVVANNTVYLSGSDSTLYALNAQTGKLNWSFKSDSRIGIGVLTTAVANDVVYISTATRLYALNGQAGQVKWTSTAVLNPFGALTVAGQLLFVGNYYTADNGVSNLTTFHDLHAIDAATGEKKWSFPFYYWTVGATFVNQNTVFVDTRLPPSREILQYLFYALDTQTGSQKWMYKSLSPTSFAFANNEIYLSGYDFLVLDAETGAKKWRIDVTGISGDSKPVIANGIAYLMAKYITDDYLNLYAIDTKTRSVKTLYKFAAQGNFYPGALAVNNNVAFVQNGSGKAVTDPQTGKEVIANAYNVYAIDVQTGKQLWTYSD